MELAAGAAVTIYSDASVTHHKAVGSWGAVIIGGGPDIELGNAFRTPITCSTTGEAQGVANALHSAIAHGRVRRGITLQLACDSLPLVDTLNGNAFQSIKSENRSRRNNPALWSAVEEIRRIIADCRAEATFVWVRGHQKLTSACPHAAGNRRADQLARHHNPFRAERNAARKARRRAKDQKVDA